MDDPVLVQVDEGVDSLPDVVGSLSFCEESFLSENIEERALTNFENQVDVLVLLVKLVQF